MEENRMDEPIMESSPKPIYSKMAVLGFCVFFSPVFGGVLLRKNLVDHGQRQAGLYALLISILLTGITALITNLWIRNAATTYVSNLIEGTIMVEYFYRKYFPNEAQIEKKSVLRPIFISLLIVLVLLAIIVSSGVPMPT